MCFDSKRKPAIVSEDTVPVLNASQQAVIDQLKQFSQRDSVTLSAWTGIPAPSVRRTIRELRAKGIRIVTGYSGYRLAA